MTRLTPIRADDAAAMCDGKDALTPATAHDVAKNMCRKGRIVEAFRCPVCGHHHVGRPLEKRRWAE